MVAVAHAFAEPAQQALAKGKKIFVQLAMTAGISRVELRKVDLELV